MTERPANYGKNWTREELILAFDLYCRIPFQKTKASTPEVQQLADLLKRSPASVARKLGNFGAFDPELHRQNISGLGHGSKLDREVWDEFNRDWNGLVLAADELKHSLEGEPRIYEEPYQPTIPNGPSERLIVAKQRIHQSFFRQAILSSYESTCCVTGLAIPQCLIASHIVPWSVNETLRADPTNGLCLSATFDRLFDSGLMTITAGLNVRISNRILQQVTQPVQRIIVAYNDKQILSPRRFLPSQEYLEWRRENVFVNG